MAAKHRLASSLQIGMRMAVRARNGGSSNAPILAPSITLVLRQIVQKPATLVQNEKEIQENRMANVATIVICK